MSRTFLFNRGGDFLFLKKDELGMIFSGLKNNFAQAISFALIFNPFHGEKLINTSCSRQRGFPPVFGLPFFLSSLLFPMPDWW